MSFDDVVGTFCTFGVCMLNRPILPSLTPVSAESDSMTSPRKLWIDARIKIVVALDQMTSPLFLSASSPIACARDSLLCALSLPMYILSVTSVAHVHISLHQEDKRCRGAKPYIDLGVSLLRVDATGEFDLLAATGLQVERQVQTDEVFLAPGQYLLVPTTSGHRLQRQFLAHQAHRASLLLKAGCSATVDDQALDSMHDCDGGHGGADGGIFSSLHATAMDDVILSSVELQRAQREPLVCLSAASCGRTWVLSKRFEQALSEIFERFDMNADGMLTKADMNRYVAATEGLPLDDVAFDWLVANFTHDMTFQGEQVVKGLLSVDAFIESQAYAVEKLIFGSSSADGGGDGSEGASALALSEDDVDERLASVRVELERLGYDANTLELVRGRALGLVVHSDVPFSLCAHPCEPYALEEAVELPIAQLGQRVELDQGRILLFIHASGFSCVSFLVCNNNDKGLVIELDCSSSINAVSNRDALEAGGMRTVGQGTRGRNSPSLLRAVERLDPFDDKLLMHLMPADADSEWSWDYEVKYLWG